MELTFDQRETDTAKDIEVAKQPGNGHPFLKIGAWF